MKISDLPEYTVAKGPFEIRWGDKVLEKKEPETKLIWRGQEILVEEFTIEHESPNSAQSIRIYGRLIEPSVKVETYKSQVDKIFENRVHEGSLDVRLDESMLDKVKEVMGEQPTMGYLDKECETACDNGYGSDRLEKKAVQLDRGEDEQLLAKYGVVRDDGTLTETGKNLLLAVVFKDSEVKGRLLETLRAIDGLDNPKAQ